MAHPHLHLRAVAHLLLQASPALALGLVTTDGEQFGLGTQAGGNGLAEPVHPGFQGVVEHIPDHHHSPRIHWPEPENSGWLNWAMPPLPRRMADIMWTTAS